MSFKLSNSFNYEPNKTIEVLDSIMGSGKSTGIIKWIDDNPNQRYIYVSPLLSEVEQGGRLQQSLNKVSFETPNDKGVTKGADMLRLLQDGVNISCTHSLYLNMSDEHFKHIYNNDYIVIIDEEIDVIGGFNVYSKGDLSWLLKSKHIDICPKDGMVSWISDRVDIDDKHKYKTFLSYCDAKALYAAPRSDSMMVTQLPVKLFECAKRVIVLTYMFKGNVLDSFLRLKGFEVKNFDEVEVKEVDKNLIRDLITLIPPNDNLMKLPMNSSWYKSSKPTSSELNSIASYIKYYASKYSNSSREVAWCVPKSRAVKEGSRLTLIKPKGFLEDADKNPCYLPSTIRATNKYSHKKVMIHCYDRYPLLTVAAYLSDYKCPINSETFALSELLQWLWRGCIRNSEPMVVAIGNKRMYNLFKNWLEEI